MHDVNDYIDVLVASGLLFGEPFGVAAFDDHSLLGKVFLDIATAGGQLKPSTTMASNSQKSTCPAVRLQQPNVRPLATDPAIATAEPTHQPRFQQP